MSSRFPNTRADAAREIVERGGITVDGDAIKVPSSDGKRTYAVRLIDGRTVCQCEDFKNRQQNCKHVLSAQIFAAQAQPTTVAS